MATPVLEYLVLADRSSDDVVDLYPVDGPATGRSSVSVPLRREPPGGVGDAQVTVASTPATPASGPVDRDEVLWTGPLTAPTGDLVLSDWSMRPLATVRVRPGRFRLTVRQSPAGQLRLDLVETS